MEAVVVGGGIGGLAAAVALQRSGWNVAVFERSPRLDRRGAALSLWPNALRALDELGVGRTIREHAALGGDSGVRSPAGVWLARSRLGDAIRDRFGNPLVIVRRKVLQRVLRDQLPVDAIRYDTAVRTVELGSANSRAIVRTAAGEHHADLVVAADGIRSLVRPVVCPSAEPPRYAGYTAWRMVVPTSCRESFETWGPPGDRFAVLPLWNGQAYCYATAAVPAGTSFDGEADEMRRRFGGWHEPIAGIVGALDDEQILRNDVEYLPPLPHLARQRVALLGDAGHAMTPDLGQGGCQALESAVELAHYLDAAADPIDALREYSNARLPRVTAIARRSRRAAQMYDLPAAIRKIAARAMDILPASMIVRGLDPLVRWAPPREPMNARRGASAPE